MNLSQKFGLFKERWSTRIVGEFDGMHVKVVKLKGEFVWHHHEKEDELFLVAIGNLTIKLRDRDINLEAGELSVAPRGVTSGTDEQSRNLNGFRKLALQDAMKSSPLGCDYLL